GAWVAAVQETCASQRLDDASLASVKRGLAAYVRYLNARLRAELGYEADSRGREIEIIALRALRLFAHATPHGLEEPVLTGILIRLLTGAAGGPHLGTWQELAIERYFHMGLTTAASVAKEIVARLGARLDEAAFAGAVQGASPVVAAKSFERI